MKKYLSTLALILLIIPCISLASIDLNLKYGSNGTEVKELQEFLIDKGFLSGQVTGNFFTLTRKAVIAYQASVGLPNTGYVGPMTRVKINAELSEADTSSNQAEITETGTTAPPTKNSATTSMQEQINALLAQLQILNAQVKTQTTVQQQIQTTLQQTQQNTQQIQQNTTPVTPPVPTPTPTPSPTPTPIPSITKDLTLTTDTPTYQLSGWGNSLTINASYSENGIRIPATITFKAPNKTATFVEEGNLNCIPSVSVNCGIQQKSWFYFTPNTLGTNTVTVTANGITKNIDISVVPYVKIDPLITDIWYVSCYECVGTPSITANGYSNSQELVIGSFKLGQADEPYAFEVYNKKYTSDVDLTYNFSIRQMGDRYQLMINPKYEDAMNNVVSIPKGTHQVTLTELKITGTKSGLYRYVQGLPVIFNYEVK